MTTSGMRRTTPARVIERTLAATEGTSPPVIAQVIVNELQNTGWRLVPFRGPASMENRSRVLALTEGKMTSRNLIEAAAEFDEITDDDLYSAADFVAWLIPEVRGTPEWSWLERRRAK